MPKLKRSTYPAGHGPSDFKCFGPPAVSDGEFDGTMLCDLGCFKQGDVDSNKYYHGAVVESKIDGKWYAYFEYGRTGSTTNPQFQFTECGSQNYAQAEYSNQLHKKNDRRGMWVDHPALGRILQPKPKKDCYLVRPQTQRSTGLPDAQTITSSPAKKTVAKCSASKSEFDPESTKLLSDLNLETMEFARSSIVGESLPTFEAIDECRKICGEATKICNNLQHESRILSSADLEDLTTLLYSRIPKKKKQKTDKSDWFLTPFNIDEWQKDLDAFESALKSQDTSVVTQTQDYPFFLESLDKNGSTYKFIKNWFLNATLNRHGGVKNVNIKHIWKITKKDDITKFQDYAEQIVKTDRIQPLHQTEREDLQSGELQNYKKAGVYMLLHGTRTVNVSGIMRESLRLPHTLSGVATNGAMFGGGLYWADDYKKSLGYTSYRGSYWSRGSGQVKNRDAFMFIADVCLGNMYVAPHSKGYRQPPNGYHSVFGKAGHSGVMNNEYITYNTASNHLKYLVEFN